MPGQNWSQWLESNLILILDLHILFFSFLVCFGLLLIHTNFMITNTTTWEKFSRRNITYLRSIKDDTTNPFHESYLKNIAQFCCYFRTVEWENVYVKFTNSKLNKSPTHQENQTSTNDTSSD